MSNVIIRAFRNTDVPGIVRLWNNSTGFVGLRRPIDSLMFGNVVLSKPYFQRETFLVAVDEDVPGGRIIGFIHGGYAPNVAMDDIDPTRPVIAMFMGAPREDAEAVASRLLGRLEEVYRRNGVTGITAGAVYPDAPFYLGLLSGGELYGFLESDPMVPYILQKNGYQLQKRHHLFRIALSGYRMLVSRYAWQMQRLYSIQDGDPSPSNLWEAISLSLFHWQRFQMVQRDTNEVCATLISRRLETSLTQEWGRRIGLHSLTVQEPFRHQGLARFFVGKVLEILSRDGFSFAELQISEENIRAINAFENLNFEKFATGSVYYKELK
ncbi:MAG: GNAT family N-acetyltransferase [Planctomycetia bacterium]|nr:GNAT family N-acetyltransferase [Planctomycetia bacterium]